MGYYVTSLMGVPYIVTRDMLIECFYLSETPEFDDIILSKEDYKNSCENLWDHF